MVGADGKELESEEKTIKNIFIFGLERKCSAQVSKKLHIGD